MSFLARLYSTQYSLRQWLVAQSYRRRDAQPALAIQPPQKVLITMAGLIGDTIMSTPLILAAQKCWPNARISVLGRSHNCALLAACPLLSCCIEATADPFSLRQRKQVSELKSRLKQEQFDLAIIALGDQFAPLLADAGIPVRVGVRGHVLQPCLTHAYEIRSAREWGPNERLNALRVLGHQVEEHAPKLWLSDAHATAARQRLERLGLSGDASYAVVHPFGSSRRQWWPLKRMHELASMLRNQTGMATVLIGGPETTGGAVSASENIIDSRGKLTIEELLGVIGRASLVISTDSGPFHIAGALGRPLVGLFRSRRPEHASRYAQARVIMGQHRACEGDCQWDVCRSLPCRELEIISTAEVAAIVDRCLQTAECVSK